MELAIAYTIIVITALILVFSNKRSLYDRGYRFAEDLFEENNMRNAVSQINKMIEKTKQQGTHDKFEQGMCRCLNDKLAAQTEVLNKEYGGDWYFDKDKLVFKDDLTTREIIL